MRTSRLRVTLRDVTPTVVRIVDVPAAGTLAETHQLLQSAIGWTDSHLHEFGTEHGQYGPPDPELDVRDETAVRLGELPEQFTYLYDYGDGWAHDVRRVGPGADRPGCPYGEGTCPPEDCGGPSGYAELVAALADPAHPDHAHLVDWASPLPDFDQQATDELVRQTAGAVPTTVRLLLDLAGDGITLTPGGRLPRVIVRRVQEHRPDWAWSEKPARVEDDLPPLCALHDLLRATGLLRLRRGGLHPLRAADDDLEVLRRLRSWFAGDPFTTNLAELSVAQLATAGPATAADLAARVLPMLGTGWVRDGRPLTIDDVTRTLHVRTAPMRGLDLIDSVGGTLSGGPSARWLLPGATRLAHHWDTHARAPLSR